MPADAATRRLSVDARAPGRTRLTRAFVLVAVTLSLSTAAPSRASALINVDQFVVQTQGTHEGECLAFVEVYLRQVYGISVTVGSDANRSAYGLAPWYHTGRTLQSDGFSWSSSNVDLQNGDILVFDKNSLGDNGHTGIWYDGRVYDANSEWPDRTTTTGADVGSTTAAAIESATTTRGMLTDSGWSTPQPYLGRWRKTPPINEGAGDGQILAGTSTATGP